MDAIIFDFGGVIFDIDYHLTAEAFNQLSQKTLNLYSKSAQLQLFDDFETGQLTPAQFRTELNQIMGTTADDGAIDRCWNAMLLDLPPARMELIYKLKQQHRIFLLSNTNPIHQETFLGKIAATIGRSYFENAFEKLYYSHEIGMRKPNSEIFEFVLKANDLVPEHTLFIDDSLPNVAAAQLTGIQGYHLKEHENLLSLDIIELMA